MTVPGINCSSYTAPANNSCYVSLNPTTATSGTSGGTGGTASSTGGTASSTGSGTTKSNTATARVPHEAFLLIIVMYILLVKLN